MDPNECYAHSMGSGWRLWWVGCVAALFGGVGRVPAAAALPPIEPRPVVWLSLRDDDAARRWYSQVPRDSPTALLPASGLWNSVVTHYSDVPLSVDGDPEGALTSMDAGEASLELGWTYAADRQIGRTYTASLASGVAHRADVDRPEADYHFAESSFEFTYIDGTSANFLPTVDLTLFDHVPNYTSVSEQCCEVVANECGSEASCYQCWKQQAEALIGGSWDGPGIPYLDLSLETVFDNLMRHPTLDAFQVIEHGEHCLEGTAATVFGESTTLTACGTPTEPPVDETSTRNPVFADTCRTLPEDTYPTTLLLATRAKTEAQARVLLNQRPAPPPPAKIPPGSFDASPDHAVTPGCAMVVGNSQGNGWLSCWGVVAAVALTIRRHRQHEQFSALKNPSRSTEPTPRPSADTAETGRGRNQGLRTW